MAPLNRNLIIIALAMRLIACPKQYLEVMRGSGTWHVIRHARKQGKEVEVVFPA